MARKITVAKTNTLNAWRLKVNQMSDYIEDLDDLDGFFRAPHRNHGFETSQDSSLVASLNTVFGSFDHLDCLLFDPYRDSDTGETIPEKCITGKVTANMLVDSGKIETLRVQRFDNYDSALVGPQNPFALYGDSGRSIWFGDSADGTYPSNFDFVADSVHINNLYMRDASVLDSAQVYDKVTVDQWTQDSGNDLGLVSDKVEFGSYVNINTLTHDSQTVHLIRPFLICGPTGNKSSPLFGAYLFDSENGHNALRTPDFSLND